MRIEAEKTSIGAEPKVRARILEDLQNTENLSIIGAEGIFPKSEAVISERPVHCREPYIPTAVPGYMMNPGVFKPLLFPNMPELETRSAQRT